MLSDIYEMVFTQDMLGKNMQNTFHLERLDPSVVAETINIAFESTILPVWNAAQINTVTNLLLQTRNLGDPLDFHDMPLTGVGAKTGASAPTYVAGGLTFLRRRTDVHNGSKRVGGVVEGEVTGNDLVAAYITQLQDIVDICVLAWEQASAPGVAVCDYIVVQRICEVTDPITGKCLQYRLPITDLELVFYKPLTGAVNAKISSQVSRKER